MRKKPNLQVDFDGVIHSYTSGWHGPDVIGDPPVKGAREFLIEACRIFTVHIYSSRSAYPDGIKAMKHYLRKQVDLPIDTFEQLHFPTQKVPAFLTIDDRVYLFRGVFPDPKNLLKFLPWNRKIIPPTRGTCDICLRENVKLNPRSLKKKVCTWCFRHGLTNESRL